MNTRIEPIVQCILLLTVLFFFIYPLCKLLFLSIQVEEGIGFQHFAHVLSNGQTWKVIKNTLWAVLGATAISVTIGVALAWIAAYTDVRYKTWIHLFALMPFIIPSYIITLAWTQLIGPVGIINKWASALLGERTVIWDVYGLDGIIVVMGLSHYPLVYLLTLSVLYRIPKDLEWAARASGANSLQVFRKVTLPLALPGIAGGGLLAFIVSLDNFGIPAFLGIPKGVTVLSTLIYEQIVGFGPSAFSRAAVLSILLGIVALLGTAVQWLVLKKSKTDSTSVEDKSIRYSLGKKRRWVEFAIWSFLIITSVVPLLAMFSTAFVRIYGLPFTLENITLKHFIFILTESTSTRRAITNSIFLASLTTIICVFVGTFLAYWRVKKNSLLTKGLENAVALPYALPGIVLGLAIILTWLQPLPGWNPGIYGTIWILFIAYVTRFMILQVRSSASSIMQVGADMEEAARINGAGFFIRWKKILFPLFLPGIMTGAFLVFLTSLTELTVSSLLWSSGAETIGVLIFNFEQAGNTALSTAFSTLIVLVISISISLALLLRKFWVRRYHLEE